MEMHAADSRLNASARKGYNLSRQALATRSLRLAQQLRDAGRSSEYRQALTSHFDSYVARTAPSCPVRRD